MTEPRVEETPAPEADDERDIVFVVRMSRETHAELEAHAAAGSVTVRALLGRLFREHTEREEEGPRGG